MDTKAEFVGKDLQEALEEASTELGIPESDLHYEIVDGGRKGVFGLGAKSVRIRVRVPVDELSDAEILEGRERDAERPAQESSVEFEPLLKDLQTMVSTMGLELELSARPTSRGVSIEFDGRDRKQMSKRRGELRQALQFLLNRMRHRRWPEIGTIQIASQGEKKDRDQGLVELAREVAQQVSRTGRTKKLQPMNAYERRLVHLTVREFQGLASSSEGDGSLKRVRISKIQNRVPSQSPRR